MLMNLRNALMAGKRLPYDAELEYLESTGTQYIDTGFAINCITDVIDCRVTVTSVKSYGTAFGVYESINEAGRLFGVRRYGTQDSWQSLWGAPSHSLYLDTFYDIHYEYGADKCRINETTGTSNTNVAYTNTIYICALNRNEATLFNAQRIYSFSIRRNGVLVRDFIPVRRGTTGYLYDRVSGKLFGNAGTGDFVLGPDVVPVEYIESHGTEWIDTQWSPNSLGRVEMDAQYTAVGSAAYSTAYYMFAQHGGTNARFNIGQFSSGVTSFGFDVSSINYLTGMPLDTDRHTFWIDAQTLSCGIDDATFSPSASAFGSTTNNSALFARNRNGTIDAFSKARMFKCEIWNNSAPVRSFRPIRVGTGSTWDGAMMDVLTRRIYRNAGTGAFTWGNDLRYPIPAE